MFFAPFRTIQKQHVSSLWAADLHSLKVFLNIIAGKVYVSGQYLTQFIYPLISFRLICSDQRVHRQNIHLVIMRFTALCHNSVSQIFVINNMIASYQSCQIKSLTWRIHRNCSVSCILTYRLSRNMFIALQNQVRPDFIRNYNAVICFINLHCFLNFTLLPYSSTWIMRATKNCHMNVICFNFRIHILKIHTPDSVLIFL